MLLLGRGGRRSLGANHSPQTQIVDDVFYALDVVLDAIDALAEQVVFEIEDLEASKDVLDEVGDEYRKVRVAEGDGVGGEAGELLGEVDEGEKILFYGKVEGVAGLEVDGNWGWV